MRRTHILSHPPEPGGLNAGGRLPPYLYWSTEPGVRRPRALLAGAVLLVTAAVVLWRLQEERARRLILEEPGQVLALLRQAAEEEPLLLPRLSGGYAYGPDPQGRDEGRSEAIRRGPRRGSLARAEAYLRRESRQRGSVEALQARAHLLLLTAAGPSPIEEAVAELEAARLRRPEEAALLSDLAAAHLLRAFTEDEPYSLLLALAAADEALDRDPGLLEALFNRALALEALALRREARSAWESYLRAGERAVGKASPEAGRDRESRWAAEARRRLALLAEPTSAQEWDQQRRRVEPAALAGDEQAVAELIGSHRTAARRWLEEELFATWAEARHEGDEEAADRSLTLAREVARAHGELTGDRLYVETVAVIEEATEEALTRAEVEADDRSTSVEATAPLADLLTGHRAYREGLEALGLEAIDRAIQRFAAAQAALHRAGSPFALRAAFQVGVCEHRKHRYAEAVDRLTALAAVAGERRYPNLQAEALWMVGLAEGSRRRFGAAQEAYSAAARLFQRTGDLDNVAGIHVLQAEILTDLGEREEAWRRLTEALALAGRLSKPGRLNQLYAIAAVFTWGQRLPRIALAFQDEAIRHALRWQDPLALIEAYRWRGRIRALAGDLEGAAQDLEEARRFQKDLVDPDARASVEAAIQAAAAELSAQQDPGAAVQALDESVRLYRESGFSYPLAALLFSRARAERALGDEDSAERDLEGALASHEAAAASVGTARERISYLEQATAVFDEMVDLLLRQGRTEEAFEIEERRRGRDLLDRLHRVERIGTPAGRQALGLAAPLETVEIRRAMPPGTALVQLALVHERLSAWVIRRESLSWIDLEWSREEVETAVERFRNDLARHADPPVLQEDGAALYDRLIAPLGELPPSVVLVPAGSLHRLPFAALYDRGSGRYLVEVATLGVSPSASLYARSLARDRALGRTPGSGGPPTALVLGAPALPRSLAGGDEPLEAAARESERIAALYPSRPGQPYLGATATEARFLTDGGACDVVHVAAHAQVNLDRPERSRILLADDPAHPDDGALYAYEIQQHRFPRTRLVVLAGCETAGGATLGSEGVASLARPFLAAGVPAVVGSLWRVEDEPTAELMVRFHRRLLQGRSAAEALQAAQVELLAGDDPTLRSPAAWAAFQVMGEARLISSSAAMEKGDAP